MKHPLIWGTTSAFCLAFLLASGCTNWDMSQYGHNYGKVSMVEKGMDINEVKSKIGKPHHIIKHDGVRINWQEYVYPTGSVFFYRLRVQKVIERSRSTPMPEDDTPDVLNPFENESIFDDDAPLPKKEKRNDSGRAHDW